MADLRTVLEVFALGVLTKRFVDETNRSEWMMVCTHVLCMLCSVLGSGPPWYLQPKSSSSGTVMPCPGHKGLCLRMHGRCLFLLGEAHLRHFCQAELDAPSTNGPKLWHSGWFHVS